MAEHDIYRQPGVPDVRQTDIDPTKNVLDLVKAESKYQDAMRVSVEKYQDALRGAENTRLEDIKALETKRLEQLMNAESKRINDLEALRSHYESRIAEDLKINVKTTSDQLAGQLVKETASLTNQISVQTSIINTRLADLERFRWETGGRSAVSDPALSLALSEMAKSITSLRDTGSQTKGEKDGSMYTRSEVRQSTNSVVGWIFGAAGIAGMVLTLVFHH